MINPDKMFCPQCKVGWPVHPEDLFCGYCKKPLFEYELAPGARLIYENCVVPETLTFWIRNTGLRTISFNPIKVKPESALSPLSGTKLFTVEPGDKKPLKVRVHPQKLGMVEGKVSVIPCHPSQKTQSLPVVLKPIPEFTINPLQGEDSLVFVDYKKNDSKATVEFVVKVQKGEFYIGDIDCDPPWLKIQQSTIKERLFASKNPDETIKFDVELSKFPTENQVETQIYLKIEGQKTFLRTFTLKPRIKPELYLVDSLEYTILQGSEHTASLLMENKTGGDLVIKNITFPGFEQMLTVKDSLPLTISGAREKKVELTLNGAALKPGQYEIQMCITSNCYRKSIITVKLFVNIKKMPTHKHYLGIDFGTTNSCVSYLDSDHSREVKLIPLEPMYENGEVTDGYEIIPSLIVYLKDEPGSYKIGNAAQLLQTSPTHGPFFIRSVKRWIGYRWKRTFPFERERQPFQVVADILNRLIEKAEKHLKEKVERCVISHPTLFSQHQKLELKQAIEACGISQYFLVDEASAAAIGAIYQRKRESKKEDEAYKFMVYDFGGGTIDIVLSEVKVVNGNIEVNPLAWGGNPRFGGDNITQFIVDLIIKKCKEEILKATGISNFNFDIPYFQPTKIRTEPMPKEVHVATIRNTKLLYQKSETIKIGLSSRTSMAIDFRFLNLVISESRNRDSNITSIVDLDNDELTAKMVIEVHRKELEEYLQPILLKTLQKMEEMLIKEQVTKLDYILLAGQSSKIPLVKKMIEDHFKNARGNAPTEVQLMEKPKECVSIGACMLGRNRRVITRQRINLKNFTDKTHSRYGLASEEDGLPSFIEMIDRGKKLPSISEPLEIPLNDDLLFDIYEHFGKSNDLDPSNTAIVGSYNFDLPNGLSIENKDRADLKMIVREKDQVELSIHLPKQKEPIIAKVVRTEPPFVDEI